MIRNRDGRDHLPELRLEVRVEARKPLGRNDDLVDRLRERMREWAARMS